MRKRKFGLFLPLLLVLALFLSGCTNPSDAATYKGGKVTIKKVQESVSAILDERIKFNTNPQDAYSGEALTRNQLQFHIFTALLTEAAKERNVYALPEEIAARRADVVKSVGSEDQLSIALVNAGIASINLDQYLSLIVLQDKLRTVIAPNATDNNELIKALQDALAKTAKNINLVVNPRYGVWNPATNQLDPADPTGGALPSTKK